jgi:hypothetical protein
MLQQFYGALKAGVVGEMLKNIARDPSLSAQLAAAYENPESLSNESLEVYFGPFVDSEQRREQLKGFSEAERNRDQLVEAVKGLRASKIPAQVLWATPTPPLIRQPPSSGLNAIWADSAK